MDDIGRAIVRLLRELDFDLGLRPPEIAQRLGIAEAEVVSRLDGLRDEGELHPTGMGFWDYGPGLPPPRDADQVS